MSLLPLCLLLLRLFSNTSADEFPSLLSSNASIAIILDREFLDTHYERLLTDVKVIIEKVLREDLRNGGLYVTYFSWSNVNLRNDYLAVFSVTNCKETWEVFDKAREESMLHMAMTEADCPRLPAREAIMVSGDLLNKPCHLIEDSVNRSPSSKKARNSLRSSTTSKRRLSVGSPPSSCTTSPLLGTPSAEWLSPRRMSHLMATSPP